MFLSLKKILFGMVGVVVAFSIVAKKEDSIGTIVAKKREKNNKLNYFSHSFSYHLQSDALDSSEQSLINHSLAYQVTYSFLEKYYALASLGGAFQSYGHSFVEYDNNKAILSLTDFTVGVGLSAQPIFEKKGHKISWSTSFKNRVPLTERSLNEGYKSIPSISLGTSWSGFNFFSLSLFAQQTYVFNSFDVDSTGTPNRSGISSGGSAITFSWKWLSLRYDYFLGVMSYLDGSQLGFSGNAVSATAHLPQNIWVSVKTSNGSTLEDPFVDLWFYDQFARVFNISAGVSF